MAYKSFKQRLVEANELDQVQDIEKVVEFFPNKTVEMIKALAARNKLKFGKMNLDVNGSGLFSEDFPSEFDITLADSFEYNKKHVEIELDINAEASDLLGAAYDPSTDEILMVATYHVDDTAELFDEIAEQFEKQTGEELDEDNFKHRKFMDDVEELLLSPISYAEVVIARNGHYNADQLGKEQAKAIARKLKSGIYK